MKIQVRRGVFETNSSSAHSFEFQTAEKHLYDLWKQGKALYGGAGLFVPKEKHLQARREKAPQYIEKLERGTEPAPTMADYPSLEKLPYLTYDEFCCLHRPGASSDGMSESDGVVEQAYIDRKGREMIFFGRTGMFAY